jgi:multiple sugar transport system substrate-binding protein
MNMIFDGIRHHLIRITGFIILGISILLSGCGQKQPTMEPATISFVYQDYEAEYYEPLVEEFMQEHPQIMVEMTEVIGNNFEAYSQADVINVTLFSYIQFQPQGVFLDLTPLIEQDMDFGYPDFYPGTIDLFSSSDKIWAIPSGIDAFVMYYNKDLFDQHGYNYPNNNWTWDDLLAGASVIRESPDIFGYGVPEPYLDINAMILMHQHGGQLFDDLDNPTKITYNHPLNVDAMQWLQDLYHEYDVAPTPDQASKSFGYGNQMIFRGVLQGDIGMWPGNFSDRGGVTWPVQWDNLSWGIVALPGDDYEVTSGFGTGYAIAANTQYPEASWLWLVFLSEQIPQTLIPARRSLAESKDFRDRVGSEAAEAAFKAVENVTLISPDLVQFGESLDQFSQAIRDIVEGNISAREALDRAQELVENP